MSKNILITESQYARIFLGESYVNPDCVKRYSCGNNKTGCWTHSTQAPYWFTLKDPFNDGFDYQWRFMDDCVRRWIRRDKKYRGEGVDLYSKNLDMTIGKDKNQIFVDGNDTNLFNKLTQEIKKAYKKNKESELKYGSLEEKRNTVNSTNEGLKALGFDTVVMTDETIGKMKWDDIPTYMFNIRGYELIKEIEQIKENAGISWFGCRGITFGDLGGNTNDINNRKIKTINPTYILNNYVKPNTWIKNAQNLTPVSLPKSEIDKYSWMSYFHMDNFPGKYTYKQIVNPSYTYNLIGKDMNWINWLSIVYERPNFRTLRSKIIKLYSNKGLNNDLNKAMCKVTKYKPSTKYDSDQSINLNYHDWIDIASAILFFIPGGQPFALGLEVINAIAYAAEGDYVGGGFGLALTLLPMGGPLLRRIGSNGIKRVNKVIKKTDTFLKTNKNATKKEINDFVQQEMKSLDKLEREALEKTLTKQNINLLTSEVDLISTMSKKQQKEYLINKSKNFQKYLTGYGKDSRYWMRQIDAGEIERLIIPLFILSSVAYKKLNPKEAVKKLKEEGYENITEKDVITLVDDTPKDILNKITSFDEDSFKIIENDSAKQQIINDYQNLLNIVDSVGTDSKFYEDYVKNNISNSQILYDLNQSINKNDKTKNVDLRDLEDSIDYKWYDFLNCENDPYSEKLITIENEDKLKEKETQEKIENSNLHVMENDKKYIYSEYNGLWFYKLKNTNQLWKLVRTCLGCSKLQKTYNREIDKILNSDFDFELEVINP